MWGVRLEVGMQFKQLWFELEPKLQELVLQLALAASCEITALCLMKIVDITQKNHCIGSTFSLPPSLHRHAFLQLMWRRLNVFTFAQAGLHISDLRFVMPIKASSQATGRSTATSQASWNNCSCTVTPSCHWNANASHRNRENLLPLNLCLLAYVREPPAGFVYSCMLSYIILWESHSQNTSVIPSCYYRMMPLCCHNTVKKLSVHCQNAVKLLL